MTHSSNIQSGNTLIFILILLIVIGLLSISLFETSLQESKNTTQFQTAITAFYTSEGCLLRAKHYIEQQTKSLQIITSCHHKNCTHAHGININLAKQPTTWWQAHGISCGRDIWQYIELIDNKANNEDVYRISIYNQQHILLQLYIDKHFSSPIHSSYSWRQVY